MPDRLPPALVVRPARPDEAAEAVRLIDALNAQQGDPTGLLAPEHIAAAAFADDPWLNLTVAALGERLVGIAAWERTFELSCAARGGYMLALWVEPEQRLCGVARALVEAVACEVRLAGGSYLWWASQPWNRVAHATYQRLGAQHKSVHAHALTFDAFEAAADRGERHHRGKD